MKCPHCLENFHDVWESLDGVGDRDGQWNVLATKCPACDRAAIRLQHWATGGTQLLGDTIVHPRAPSRTPLPDDVPESFASDYREACLVLADSPKASAALSRRCLQNLLREKAGVKASDLSKEIDEALASGSLPSHLGEGLDAVRNYGNFGTHPIKSTNSGEIVEVDPGEAEWSLDILEGLFDFYFVQPAILQRKKGALNQKLADAGKPPMK